MLLAPGTWGSIQKRFGMLFLNNIKKRLQQNGKTCMSSFITLEVFSTRPSSAGQVCQSTGVCSILSLEMPGFPPNLQLQGGSKEGRKESKGNKQIYIFRFLSMRQQYYRIDVSSHACQYISSTSCVMYRVYI